MYPCLLAPLPTAQTLDALIMGLRILLLPLSLQLACCSPDAPGIHLPLYRRGGPFITDELVNTTRLTQALATVEARYARTYTDVEGNRIVRRWRNGPHDVDDYLLDGAGLLGSWYTTMQIGTPPQTLEVDLDMLSPDFYTVMTTSGKGSKYDTFASSSHEPSSDYAHSVCLTPTDVFHFPTIQAGSIDLDKPITLKTSQTRLYFPICQPPKCTHHTLAHSGSILGLSPIINTDTPSSLSRLTTPPFLTQILSKSQITTPLIHITLLTPTSGLLSLGSPPTSILESTKIRLEKQLSHLSADSSSSSSSSLQDEIRAALAFAVPPGSTHDTHFQWLTDQGAARGWHAALLAGLWVDGVKVLRNQAVLFDINCPVILAPRGVAETVYGAIGAAVEVDMLFDDVEPANAHGGDDDDIRGRKNRGAHTSGHTLWAIPCLNPVPVEAEIAGWRFPLTPRDATNLGKVDTGTGTGTGYCVGAIVETDMGRRRGWAGSGMRDVWVLGEPFFRAVGVALEFGGAGGRGGVGVRRY